MPKGSPKGYKDLYSMGKRLQEMAISYGYNPESESEEEEAPEVEEDSDGEYEGGLGEDDDQDAVRNAILLIKKDMR